MIRFSFITKLLTSNGSITMYTPIGTLFLQLTIFHSYSRINSVADCRNCRHFVSGCTHIVIVPEVFLWSVRFRSFHEEEREKEQNRT